jgi:hypothetical protein
VLTFGILVFYLVLSRIDTPLQYGEHPVDVLKGNTVNGGDELAPVFVEPFPATIEVGPEPIRTALTPVPVGSSTSVSSAEVVEPTLESGVSSQQEFQKEYDVLGL